jgi:prevent-host-death family protein
LPEQFGRADGSSIRGDTTNQVTEVSIRELRNHGGEVVDRVAQGEKMTVTRDGEPVALLQPLSRPPYSLGALLERWSNLPPMDPAALRRDVDSVIDQRL